MKPWKVTILFLAAAMLTLAGCSSYKPGNIPVGGDSAPAGSGWATWLLCLLILGVCVGFLFRDGLWGNAIRLVNVVFAGLLAMNFYEPLATWLMNYGEEFHSYAAFWDFLALWTCFIVCVAVFRAVTDTVSRVRVRFLKIIDLWGGVVLSLCIGWVMVGFTLVSLHAAPLGQYPLLGSFQPRSNMFFGMFTPDREWLGFTRYQSSGPFCRSADQDCKFPSDFIEKQFERRMHIEKYINGNKDHAIRVNKDFMKPGAKPTQMMDISPPSNTSSVREPRHGTAPSSEPEDNEAGAVIFMLVFMLLLSLACFVFWLMMLINCLRSSRTDKVVWVVLLLLIPPLGLILYFFIAYGKKEGQRR